MAKLFYHFLKNFQDALTMCSQIMQLLLWAMEQRMVWTIYKMIIKINLLPQVWITGQSRTPGAQTGGKRVTSESKGKTD